MKYIYQLGHCPQLGLQEITFATSQNLESDLHYDAKTKITLGQKSVDCNILGSVVWSAGIVCKISSLTSKFTDLYDNLAIMLEVDKFREIGFFCNFEINDREKSELYSFLKTKTKRVNILVNQQPNYGFWKKTKHWFGIMKIEGEFYLFKIDSMCDQQYWTELEEVLPNTDIGRGVINLKLARTLLNLTNNVKIWDPFAGQGRIICSGLTLKKSFFASDIDKTVLPQLEENFEAAFDFLLKNKKPDQTLSLATLDQSWAEDAKKNKSSLDANCENLAIVTEGHLGMNPSKKAITHAQAVQESTQIDYLWQGLLVKSKMLDIKEIVGCVPFYPQIGFMPKYGFMDDDQYKLEFQPINYSRPKAQVGHWVFKLKIA